METVDELSVEPLSRGRPLRLLLATDHILGAVIQVCGVAPPSKSRQQVDGHANKQMRIDNIKKIK